MKRVEIYCDGGCRGNQHKKNLGGYGTIVYGDFGSEPMEYKGALPNSTNNRMELYAAIVSLQELDDDVEMVFLYTDSNYVVRGVNRWSDDWVVNGWRTSRNKSVGNKDLWVTLLREIGRFKTVIVEHCPRDSHPGNVRADELANIAMDEYEESRAISRK